jgi:hypothetical protein
MLWGGRTPEKGRKHFGGAYAWGAGMSKRTSYGKIYCPDIRAHRGRADASAWTWRGRSKKTRKIIIKMFGFQSPRFPSFPSSAGFASEAARRRRFFRPSSPSHPSKLYSSPGWLNSKVPKLFFPLLQGLLMLMASRVGTLWSLGNLIDLELNLCSIESNEGVTMNIIIIAP